MGKSRISNKKCNNPKGDCEVLDVSISKKCDYHRNMYKPKKYPKNKKVDAQTKTVTPKDVIASGTCDNCAKAKKEYNRLAKQSKYNINLYNTLF